MGNVEGEVHEEPTDDEDYEESDTSNEDLNEESNDDQQPEVSDDDGREKTDHWPQVPEGSFSSGSAGNASASASARVPAVSPTNIKHRSAMAPRTPWQLRYRAHYDYDWAAYAADWHDLRASRWTLADTWLRLIVAVAASFSALSLFAESPAITGAFAVATALVSALNAAVDPPQRAIRNRKAATDYRHLTRVFSTLCGNIDAILETRYIQRWIADPKTGLPCDQGYYADGEMSPSEQADLAGELMNFEDALETVDDSAPPIGRLLARTPDGAPLTRFGLWRYRARAKRALAYKALRKQYEPLLEAEPGDMPGGSSVRTDHTGSGDLVSGSRVPDAGDGQQSSESIAA
jgi:hypothetical protein